MVCHHMGREDVCRVEPLTVMRSQLELGRRAQIALRITCGESLLLVPHTTRNGRELARLLEGGYCLRDAWWVELRVDDWGG